MQKSFALSCISLLITLLCIFCLGGCQSDFSADSTDSTTTQTIENSTERTTEPLMDETTTTLPQAEELTTPPVAEESTTEPITEETSTETEEKPVVPEKPLELKQNTYHFCKNRENFKRFGRMVELTDGLTCDFTASGVEFWGRMQGNVTVSLSCDRDTYFTVFIDGVRVEERFYATPTTKELCIASFEDGEEHTIRFLKQTEVQWSLCVLESVSITGFLFPAPENREFLIEFIGDSITCGYGNLGNPSTPVAGIASMQDGTQAFAFLTAEALNAEANMVSCSGIGIAKGWTAINELEFYQRTSHYRDPEMVFDDNSRVPNLIVINLGTNDQDRGCEEQAFKAKMKELILFLRDFYGPDVPIVWMYNMMTYGCFTWARPVLAELGGEDAGLYAVQFTPNKQGAGNHPELAAHYAASEQLVQFIKDKQFLEKSDEFESIFDFVVDEE